MRFVHLGKESLSRACALSQYRTPWRMSACQLRPDSLQIKPKLAVQHRSHSLELSQSGTPRSYHPPAVEAGETPTTAAMLPIMTLAQGFWLSGIPSPH